MTMTLSMTEQDPTTSACGPNARPPLTGTAAGEYPQSPMRVKKRNGRSEPVDLDKIVRAVSRCCVVLGDVDPMRVATKTISGLYDGATTRELDQLSIQTAAGLIAEEPQYARLAARLLATTIDKEVRGQEIHAFSRSVAFCADNRLATLGLPKRYGTRNPLSFIDLHRSARRAGGRELLRTAGVGPTRSGSRATSCSTPPFDTGERIGHRESAALSLHPRSRQGVASRDNLSPGRALPMP